MNSRILIAACAALCATAAPAFAQTKVTSIAAPGTTDPKVWYEHLLTAGGTMDIVDLSGLGGNLENDQPLPAGAAQLTTDDTDAARAEIAVLDDYGMPNAILDTLALGYSYHKASNAGQNLAAAPTLKLAFINQACPGGGDCFGELVYEPYWNQPGNEGTSVNPPLDTWTSVSIDKDNGLFWTTGMFGEANSAGGPPLRTLAEWAAVFNEDFGTSTLFRVSVGVGTFNRGQVGYFDNVSIAHSGYAESYDFDIEAAGGPQATFQVTSTFSDGNPAATDVVLTCNGGLPLQQEFTITGGDPAGVTFSLSDFSDGAVRCELTASATPAGYATTFDNGVLPSSESCVFEAVVADGAYSCEIGHQLQPVEFDVFAVYDVSPGEQSLDSTIEFAFFCENFRITPSSSLENQSGTFQLSESNSTTVGTFFPNYTTPETRCRFDTTALNSSVELDDGCSDWVVMQPGDESVSCTVTATLFFEGIPAVGPRGLALLALLMLGMGWYGMRRWA